MTDRAGKSSPRRVARRHHKVDRLPGHVLDQVRERVQRGEPYERVEAWLVEQGHPVGHSSIHRWHKFIREGLPRADERARLAEMLVSASAVDPSVVQNAAYQLVMQQTLDLLLAADEPDAPSLDPDELAKIMSGLARLGGTATNLTKHLDEKRRRQLAEANRKLDALAAEGGFAPAVVQKIKQLYGLQSPPPPANEPEKPGG